jgi:hypothetical protein
MRSAFLAAVAGSSALPESPACLAPVGEEVPVFTPRRRLAGSISLCIATLAIAQPREIPPPGGLAGSTGGTGEIALAWDTPLFELSGDNACYDVRWSTAEINMSNWGQALAFDVDWPDVEFNGSFTIDLSVSAQSETDGLEMSYDHVYMRAWLVAWIEAGNLIPYGHVIRNETIEFTVEDADGNVVATGSDTTDANGMAEFHTGDINDDHDCDDPNWPLYRFKGHWDGHSIELSNGLVITSGDQDDHEDMMTCNGSGWIPPAGMWGSWGGTYNYAGAGLNYEVFVPAMAVTGGDVPVTYAPELQPPPPLGLPPGVPGVMFAFHLEKQNGPYLNRPVVITAEYPPEMLLEYGGLGESSLRAYRFEPLANLWLPLPPELGTFMIQRETHRVRFATQLLGLLAVAAQIDGDHDGLGEFEELERGLQPGLPDTDGDGVSDGDEIWFTRSDPLDPGKSSAADQRSSAAGLVPGRGYYVAARIVCGQSQSPVSNCVYVMAGGSVPGDLDCDGDVDFGDINPFVLALSNPAAWEALYPTCDLSRGDIDGNGVVGFGDINPFVALLTGGG